MSTAAATTTQLETSDVAPGMVVTLGPFRRRITDKEFEKFCAQNPDLRIELTKEGQLIIMMPVVPEGGHRNFKLTTRFGVWAEDNDLGVGFDSSTCFTLPNGAKHSPDVSWLRKERWEALTEEERKEFTHICPDFVVELRSKTDRLKPLQTKLAEYIENGAQLGWLIDPIQHKVHIYRPDTSVEILHRPETISGESLLPGFVLKLDGIID